MINVKGGSGSPFCHMKLFEDYSWNSQCESLGIRFDKETSKTLFSFVLFVAERAANPNSRGCKNNDKQNRQEEQDHWNRQFRRQGSGFLFRL